MSRLDYIEFKDIFKTVKTSYPNIIDLSEPEIAVINEQSKDDNLKYETRKSLIIILGATLSILLIPITVVKINNSINLITEYIRASTILLTAKQQNIISLSLFAGSLAFLIYIYLFPAKTIFGKTVHPTSHLYTLDKKNKSYIKFAVIGTYLVLGFIIYTLILEFKQYSEVLYTIFNYYLAIPLILLGVFIIMFAVVFLIIMPFLKFRKKTPQNSNRRIRMIYIISNVLNKLNEYENLHLISFEQTQKLINSLSTASNILKNYPYYLTNTLPSQSLLENFRKAANQLDGIIVKLCLGAKSETDKTKNDLIDFFNFILVGDLLELPKSDVVWNNNIKTKKVKFYHYLLLAIYLTLPILIVLLANLAFKITFSDYTQSLLKILYIVWAFVGIFSNPLILNSENKDLIKDIIKSWFGK